MRTRRLCNVQSSRYGHLKERQYTVVHEWQLEQVGRVSNGSADGIDSGCLVSPEYQRVTVAYE